MDIASASAVVSTLLPHLGPNAQLLDCLSTTLPASAAGVSIIPAGSLDEAFGQHRAYAASRDRLVDRVEALLASGKAGRQLSASLSSWLASRHDAAACAAALAFSDQWLHREAPFDGEVKAIQGQAALLPKRSLWTLASDGFGAGSNVAGVHAFLASGLDHTLLLLASDPSSEAAAPGAAPRQDLGLYALTYGGCYVASCSAASPQQLEAACAEAASFQGPSLLLVLLPPSAAAAQAAADSGAWPLYRWDPRKEAAGAAAFTLDSSKLREDMTTFLARDSHLALLTNATPSLPVGAEAEEAAAAAAAAAALAQSYQRLMGAIELPPLHVLYASDGGNAEGLAKRIAAEARKRGYGSVSVGTFDALAAAAGDSSVLARLAALGTAVFVVSTAGQGEFPTNGRELWKGLAPPAAAAVASAGGGSSAAAPPAPAASGQAAAAPGPLAPLRYAVFGLGDSNYWPRKEHAHFFNKSSVDLAAALRALGGQALLPRGSGDDQSKGGFLGDFKRWAPELWLSLGVGIPGEDGSEGASASTRAPEAIKPTSNYLRGTIAQGLLDTSTGALAYEDTILTKFHGIYQQDNRDERGARKRAGLEPSFSFMVRVRIPGGVCSPAQYTALDAIADTHANGTLRVTTRQAIQFHGIIKGQLKPSIAAINRALMDTLAACGDVNRNVMCTPHPEDTELHAAVLAFTRQLSDELSPRTSAYGEIWLDKVLVGGGSSDLEPLYGPTYLPRKFKIAVAMPPYNDVDVYAHCLGFVAIAGAAGQLEGFTLTVGGGMGMTHNAPATFPRLAQDFCFASPADAVAIAAAIITIQRDFGDRTNRRHARFKYTVDDRGLEWLAAEVASRTGLTIAPPRPYTFTSNGDRLGWSPGPAGTSNYTLFVQNGRIVDKGGVRMKSGLAAFAAMAATSAAAIGMHVRFTANQNAMLACVPAGAVRAAVEGLLAEYGLENTTRASGLRLNSMACVALPTCGLSLAESERYLPSLLDRLDGELEAAGLRDDAIVIRMTGCPNGCARPYVAEIGLVGRSPGIYNLYLGAGFSGERLNKLHREDVGEEAIVGELGGLFKRYALERSSKGEHFGDWVVRAGVVKATVSGRTFHDL